LILGCIAVTSVHQNKTLSYIICWHVSLLISITKRQTKMLCENFELLQPFGVSFSGIKNQHILKVLSNVGYLVVGDDDTSTMKYCIINFLFLLYITFFLKYCCCLYCREEFWCHFYPSKMSPYSGMNKNLIIIMDVILPLLLLPLFL
jgi:hypothetical protein